MVAFRNPKYFFVAFGEPHAEKYPVEGGVYPHVKDKDFLSNLEISAGDVMLLYCCDGYYGHDQEAPGLGVVTSVDSTEKIIYYQYFPLDQPVYWDTIKASIPELKGKTMFNRAGNFVRKISNNSFRTATASRQIAWP